MSFLRKALFWGFVAILANTGLKFFLALDTNKRQFNHAPGRCRYVTGIQDGSEDIELLEDGTALISSGLRYTNVSELKGVVGKIYMYEFSETNESKAIELKIVSKTLDMKDFNPHGMSTWVEKGQTYLYVVNHLPDGDAIERFTFEKEKKLLTHTKTIKHPTIFSANDLVMTGLDKFYVTNDHYFKNQYLVQFEALTLAHVGSIVYYDGTNAKTIDQWLPSPNGINIDKGRKQLYVSMIWTKSIRIYDIQKDMNITFKRDLKTHTCTDNLFVDQATGDIWAGAHPIFLEIHNHLNHPKTQKAPSQVLRVRVAKKTVENDFIAEPYSNDGNVLSGSTVAVRFKNQFLVGTVYHKLLLCDILAPELI